MADSSYVPATGVAPSFWLPAPQVRLAQNNNGALVQVSNDNPGLPRHKSYCDFSYGRYAFRWAATDLSDTHSPQQRVSGPLSPIITVGQAVHPFVDEWIDWGAGMHKAATPNPASSENVGKAWIGERRQNDV